MRWYFLIFMKHDAGWIAVLDDGPTPTRFLGVLTPGTLHAALRRSVEAEAQGLAPREVSLETIQEA